MGKQFYTSCEEFLFPLPDLSASAYDIAITSLVEGPQQATCIQWLLDNQRELGIWGAEAELCWYDAYVCTYAAAVALRNAGVVQLADLAIENLTRIVPERIDDSPDFDFWRTDRCS